ncbi:phosphoglycerate kinase [Candidatus Pantoea carbekii]|uniref:Phosphoglycerate kinase n=1 Tax=Candidatus Pantoea carbekii TaxID=1235990 RepID=U3U5J1_9GAMM|nr:phosphoglycerate kinase [Candidatus Pantoea carbekii]AKC32383.1 phosphoglycerate kinase [Candidatus Pantoea carbekii]BAO00105.1 Pgk protein [Candidatus Pantoea carbekii]
MPMIKMTDLNLSGKRVLIRADLNVPLQNGKITSDARICASLPTIKILIQQGAKVMLTSHLGRPIEGTHDEQFSLLPIVKYLSNALKGIKVSLSKKYLDGIEVHSDELIVLENVRFNKGEHTNDQALSKKYAELCDVFVMDAFGSAHRAQASTHGISRFAAIACAGPLLCAELKALSKVMTNPQRPLIVIVGGSKISTKFNILTSLVKIADTVIVGGGIANTFLAIDNKVGKSLCEKNFIKIAKNLRDNYHIPLPTDCRISSTELFEAESVKVKKISEIEDNDKIMDFGDETAQNMANILKKAKTILWNGPVGMFELQNFRKGTESIANAIAESNAFSVAGGGDTLAAIDLFNIKDKISYICTGGGAFLKFIEGKKLPAIAALEEFAQRDL